MKVGGLYFVSTNVDVQDGLFNGATGCLRKIEYGTLRDGSRAPKAVWCEFENSLIGSKARSVTKRYQERQGIPLNLVRIGREKRNLSVAKERKLQIVREQIPLVAANGMTIHKSQGSSLDSVVVSVEGMRPTARNYRELIYVACSRATSKEGLFIKGNFQAPLPPMEDDPVTEAMKELRERPVSMPFLFLQDIDDGYFKLYCHNVNGFLKKREDILADQCAMASNILAIIEPKICQEDNDTAVNISPFQTLHRSHCSKPRNSKGLLLFTKGNFEMPLYEPTLESNGNCQFLELNASGTIVVIVYKSPTFSRKTFQELLKQKLENVGQKNAVFIGDINIHIWKEDGAPILRLFNDFGYNSKIPANVATNDQGNSIDICFSNNNVLQASLYESYYSDHKPIIAFWPK